MTEQQSCKLLEKLRVTDKIVENNSMLLARKENNGELHFTTTFFAGLDINANHEREFLSKGQKKCENCEKSKRYIVSVQASNKICYFCSIFCLQSYVDVYNKFVWKSIHKNTYKRNDCCLICNKKISTDFVIALMKKFCTMECINKYLESESFLKCKLCSKRISFVDFGKYTFYRYKKYFQLCGMECQNRFREFQLCYYCTTRLNPQKMFTAVISNCQRHFCTETCYRKYRTFNESTNPEKRHCAICQENDIREIYIDTEMKFMRIYFCNRICFFVFFQLTSISDFKTHKPYIVCFYCRKIFLRNWNIVSIFNIKGNCFDFCSENCKFGFLATESKKPLEPCDNCSSNKHYYDFLYFHGENKQLRKYCSIKCHLMKEDPENALIPKPVASLDKRLYLQSIADEPQNDQQRLFRQKINEILRMDQSGPKRAAAAAADVVPVSKSTALAQKHSSESQKQQHKSKRQKFNEIFLASIASGSIVSRTTTATTTCTITSNCNSSSPSGSKPIRPLAAQNRPPISSSEANAQVMANNENMLLTQPSQFTRTQLPLPSQLPPQLQQQPLQHRLPPQPQHFSHSITTSSTNSPSVLKPMLESRFPSPLRSHLLPPPPFQSQQFEHEQQQQLQLQQQSFFNDHLFKKPTVTIQHHQLTAAKQQLHYPNNPFQVPQQSNSNRTDNPFGSNTASPASSPSSMTLQTPPSPVRSTSLTTTTTSTITTTTLTTITTTTTSLESDIFDVSQKYQQLKKKQLALKQTKEQNLQLRNSLKRELDMCNLACNEHLIQINNVYESRIQHEQHQRQLYESNSMQYDPAMDITYQQYIQFEKQLRQTYMQMKTTMLSFTEKLKSAEMESQKFPHLEQLLTNEMQNLFKINQKHQELLHKRQFELNRQKFNLMQPGAPQLQPHPHHHYFQPNAQFVQHRLPPPPPPQYPNSLQTEQSSSFNNTAPMSDSGSSLQYRMPLIVSQLRMPVMRSIVSGVQAHQQQPQPQQFLQPPPAPAPPSQSHPHHLDQLIQFTANQQRVTTSSASVSLSSSSSSTVSTPNLPQTKHESQQQQQRQSEPFKYPMAPPPPLPPTSKQSQPLSSSSSAQSQPQKQQRPQSQPQTPNKRFCASAQLPTNNNNRNRKRVPFTNELIRKKNAALLRKRLAQKLTSHMVQTDEDLMFARDKQSTLNSNGKDIAIQNAPYCFENRQTQFNSSVPLSDSSSQTDDNEEDIEVIYVPILGPVIVPLSVIENNRNLIPIPFPLSLPIPVVANLNNNNNNSEPVLPSTATTMETEDSEFAAGSPQPTLLSTIDVMETVASETADVAVSLPETGENNVMETGEAAIDDDPIRTNGDSNVVPENSCETTKESIAENSVDCGETVIAAEAETTSTNVESVGELPATIEKTKKVDKPKKALAAKLTRKKSASLSNIAATTETVAATEPKVRRSSRAKRPVNKDYF